MYKKILLKPAKRIFPQKSLIFFYSVKSYVHINTIIMSNLVKVKQKVFSKYLQHLILAKNIVKVTELRGIETDNYLPD